MRVVNIKDSAYDVYCGRKLNTYEHFGNPYSHLDLDHTIKVGTRAESIKNFELWLLGRIDTNINQEQRKWILDNIDSLYGKTLGCYCSPKRCHCEVLVRIIKSKKSDFPF